MVDQEKLKVAARIVRILRRNAQTGESLKETMWSGDTDDGYATDEELAELVLRLQKLEDSGWTGDGIEGIEVNGTAVYIDPETRTAKLTIPVKIEDLEDGGDVAEKGDLPDFQNDGLNGVTQTEDGKLEVTSVSLDRVETEGYTLILEGGRAENDP